MRRIDWLVLAGLWLGAAACSDDDDDAAAPVDDDDDTAPADDDDDDADPSPRLVPRFDDNRLRVGMAKMDVAPVIRETFIDWNGNHEYGELLPYVDADGDDRWDTDETMIWEDADADGVYDPGERIPPLETIDMPMARAGREPFTDADADGEFDAVWIAGFNSGRAANTIHDPTMAVATVLSFNEEYVVWVSLDVVGILAGRTRQMGLNLQPEGFDPRRLIVNANHTHQSPDTIGIWGESISSPGYDPAYQAYLETAVPQVVKDAVAALVPAEAYGGTIRMSEFDPWQTSAVFGGANPKPDRQIGLTHDIRDPIVVDDHLTVLQFRHADTDAVIGTYTNWSGHPEVVGSDSNAVSSDYNFFLRRRLEELYGGIAHAAVSDVGGMQSALGAWIPLYGEDGARLMEDDGAGGERPVLVMESGWDFARSQGYALAEAAQILLAERTAPLAIESLSVQNREILIPMDNALLYAGVISSLIDAPKDQLVDKAECGGLFTCAPANLWYVRLDPAIHVATAPGELLPELFLGLPEAEDFDDPRPNRWFPQHDPAQVLTQHADPFTVPPAIRGSMGGAAANFLIGLAESEFGYIVPESDYVFPGLDNDFDHYEETLSLGQKAGTVIGDALRGLAEDSQRDRLPID